MERIAKQESERGNHVIIPIRLILADKKECKVKTNGLGHVNISNSCKNLNELWNILKIANLFSSTYHFTFLSAYVEP